MQTELNYDIVFNAQEHFRLLLDSMSRPGKINTFPLTAILPPEGFNQGAALTGFALLNSDVTFYIAGDNSRDIADYILVNTGSRKAEMSVADYIFLPEEHSASGLEDARVGTPIYPEESATLIAQAGLISEQPFEGALALTLKGPGVNGEAEVFVSGVSDGLLDFVKEQNAEYPLGTDLIITGRDNHILCIPRSNKFTYTKQGQNKI
ncbi:MAG: phosphonate C-P lyase system protein PhnH [Sphingobacteriales bacterium]